MKHLNIEIKAKCADPQRIRKILKSKKARYIGKDRQIDTYFRVPKGRLKLREGKIENALIYYERKNQSGPKESKIILYSVKNSGPLKEILTRLFGILTVVDKKREIYFIQNIKFHIDHIKNLGDFVEIEVIDEKGILGKEKLKKDCEYFMKFLQIRQKDLVRKSYSDMVNRSLKFKVKCIEKV